MTMTNSSSEKFDASGGIRTHPFRISSPLSTNQALGAVHDFITKPLGAVHDFITKP